MFHVKHFGDFFVGLPKKAKFSLCEKVKDVFHVKQ